VRAARGDHFWARQERGKGRQLARKTNTAKLDGALTWKIPSRRARKEGKALIENVAIKKPPEEGGMEPKEGKKNKEGFYIQLWMNKGPDVKWEGTFRGHKLE